MANARIQFSTADEQTWQTVNPTLREGELVLSMQPNGKYKMKVGGPGGSEYNQATLVWDEASAEATRNAAQTAQNSAEDAVNEVNQSIIATRQNANAAAQSATEAANTIATIRGYRDEAKTSETNAKASENRAATSESNASGAATRAANSASEASEYKTNAQASATAAKESEDLAKQYRDEAFSATPAGYEELTQRVATHTSEIAKINNEQALQNRKISASLEMQKGITYRFETDSTEAYSKVIPTGAKAFDLKMLGGKSLVFNQLNEQNQKETTTAGITWTLDNDGWYIANGTSTSSIPYRRQTTTDGIGGSEMAGHKVYFRYVCSNEGERNISYGLYPNSTRYTTSMIRTLPNDYLYTRLQGVNGGYEYINARARLEIFDLTRMGMEDITMEEFDEMFPNYIPYTEPIIISASVNNVKVRGCNLWNGQIGEIGKALSPTTLKSYSSASSFYTDYITIDDDIDYVVASPTGTNASVAGSVWYDENKDAISGIIHNQGTPYCVLEKPANAKYLRCTSGADKTDVFQVQFGKTPTEHKSYNASAFSNIAIPNEIQQLDGYGWSAGNVYNEIDFARKVFVKRVGRVDLGSLNWGDGVSYNENVPTYYTRMNIGAKRHPSSELIGLLCTKGYRQLGRMTSGMEEDKIIVVNSSSHTENTTYIADSNYADLNTFKEAMQGVYLYYELETPQEIDISDILGNDFEAIQCEANGTITFNNANADYHLPVPNEEEYMIKLSEV